MLPLTTNFHLENCIPNPAMGKASTMVSQCLFAVFLALAGIGGAAKLEPVASFGDNPTKLSMNIYVPDKLASKPPVIIVVSTGATIAPQLA